MQPIHSEQIIAKKIALAVKSAGGHAFFVGGCVRDRLMGKVPKDFDIEVHGIDPQQLKAILSEFGEVLTIGEHFGIYTLKGTSLDFALPRKEKVTGNGHRDFEIFVDPFIGTKAAAQRRDFTVNAMMQDVLTKEIIDHFNGQDDLKKGILRHVNDAKFAEDPLRVLRAAQFAARFEFDIADETTALCRKIDLSTLPKERIEAELKKALIQAEKPSIFFETLRAIDQLDCWFPEIKQLIGIPQNPKFHPEGDVWQHTMLALDQAVKFRNEAENPYAFMLLALTHDLGKVVATETINGVIHAYGHETAGLPLIEKALHRFTDDHQIHRYVLNMTEHHMSLNQFAAQNTRQKSYNKLFDSVCSPEDLILFAKTDAMAKANAVDYSPTEKTLREKLLIFYDTMAQPHVTGKDLLDAGIPAGEQMGELLAYAHKLRLAGVDKKIAMKQVIAIFKQNRKTK